MQSLDTFTNLYPLLSLTFTVKQCLTNVAFTRLILVSESTACFTVCTFSFRVLKQTCIKVTQVHRLILLKLNIKILTGESGHSVLCMLNKDRLALHGPFPAAVVKELVYVVGVAVLTCSNALYNTITVVGELSCFNNVGKLNS